MNKEEYTTAQPSKEDNYTNEQKNAIEKQGKVIVSASAGSGKTTVMIERLTRYIMDGGDLDDVLAVTFTKKAAAHMKEKLRGEIRKKINQPAVTAGEREHLKKQLAKIPTANISTIHSFCVYLLRTHFYLLDIDGSFDVMSEDDGTEGKLRQRAMDSVFDRFYREKDPDFMLVLSCYTKKRSDSALRKKIAAAYDSIRIYDGYIKRLEYTADIYTEENFYWICSQLNDIRSRKCKLMAQDVESFKADFCKKIEGLCPSEYVEAYIGIFDEISDNLDRAVNNADFFGLPEFTSECKKKRGSKDKIGDDLDKSFDKMKAAARDAYNMFSGVDKENELEKFLANAPLAVAFANVVLAFDKEYTQVKREESKLDFNDLEHLTLKLLQDETVKREVSSGFKRVFVDEYQDVNPVQEAIISAVSGQNVFLVGDVKQAIYGFRGSKSRLFTDKFNIYKAEGEAHGSYALTLPHNFRSAPKVIGGVNKLFSRIMTPDMCDIDYADGGVMESGGGYTAQDGTLYEGGVTLHTFGKEESGMSGYSVYSVEAADKASKKSRSREGLAVAEIVKSELGSTFYDCEKKVVRSVTPADICILTRKNDNDSVRGIIKELNNAGYHVSGNKGSDVRDTPECKQIIDILSYVDNGEQDVPMASAMLSPIGNFTESDLAAIRIADAAGKSSGTFRAACSSYLVTHTDDISRKLTEFNARIDGYRRLSALFGAATLIDEILTDGQLEAVYMQGNGAKLKNVRRLAADAVTSGGELSVSDFLDKIRMDDYQVNLAQSGGSGSITIMTMHASKGLEFPIVIIADVCRQFKGGGKGEPPVPLDEQFGFVHQSYDQIKHTKSKNILNIVYSEKNRAEEIKNEMNLLYVACTRAKYRLHILASEKKPFSLVKASCALTHADLLDMALLPEETCHVSVSGGAAENDWQTERPVAQSDGEMLAKLRENYQKPYAYAASIDLPVKSSASAILHMQDLQQEAPAEELFPEEQADKGIGGTSADEGTAYHKYLELCDFAVKDGAGIASQIESFVKSGLMESAQADLLNVDNLVKILNMEVFNRVKGKTLYREQEFLCYLPADKFLDTQAEDNVMVQGAIDLLCVGESECAIIDYKYSKKSDGRIIATYSKQLDLYRKAVSKITGLPETRISATIVNIYRLHEIPLI